MRPLRRTRAGARPRPGSSLSGLAAVLAAALLLSGCAVGGSGEGAGAGTDLPPELGAEAGPLRGSDLRDPRGGPPDLDWWDESDDEIPEDEEAADQGGGTVSRTTSGGTAAGSSGSGAGSSGASAEQVTTLASVSDPRGDTGGGPGYADLRRVTLADGGRRAVVTVDMDARIPKTLAEGEVMGVGVDLYYGTDQESDYQLFADGGSDGWRAYLHTPRGFVDYPGAFRLGKGRLVFEVPWRALGRPRSGSVSSFADWSRRASPLNEFSEDVAPDRGRASFTR